MLFTTTGSTSLPVCNRLWISKAKSPVWTVVENGLVSSYDTHAQVRQSDTFVELRFENSENGNRADPASSLTVSSLFPQKS